ncbi:MAG: tetratricopeptide repeat protein [Acidobacteria bacterium]|nr:tetratricopeptide repeat protein [Acidobacteriota bacterium]MCB9377586.1 tetratricopeptide repeat protein [Holophagales bacterium]
MRAEEVEQWRVADRLFEDLEALDDRARSARLAELEPGVRAKVEALLAADEESGRFLDEPLDARLAFLAPGEPGAASGSSLGGRRIGRWTLEEEIGKGGSAVVYRARRAEGPVEQKVAVKLLTLALLGREGESRFEHEQQVLARLHHPDIATLIDGGTAEDGTPYLVTELVDGRRLDRWCDEAELGLRERIGLFIDVCEAVAFAHRNLVVHRDLKPSNILVDGEGRVRLLDFGIAKLLDAGQATQWARMLTPGYAAPEQISGGPVTTATDVFALGVVLYKLLTGALPAGFESRSPISASRAPAKPSTAATKLRIDADLDAIVLKATRPEPERRYPSARDLADDLGRWLEGRPVDAGPDSAAYRLRKFVGRHRLAVVASALTLLGILVGSALALWQAGVAHEESARAQRARDEAESVTAFLVGTFEAADPLGTRGGDVTAREILRAGVERIDQELSDQPGKRQRLQLVLGEVSRRLGEFDESRALYQAALAGPEMAEKERVQAVLGAARVTSEAGDYPPAEELFQQAVRLAETSDPGTRAEVELAFASHLTNSYQDALAEERLRTLLAAGWFQESSGPAVRCSAVTTLAVALLGQGRLEEAREQAERGLALAPDGEAQARDRRAMVLNVLSGIEQDLGDLDRAADLEQQALDIFLEIYGATHPLPLRSQNNLAALLKMKGRFEESATLLRQVIAVQAAALGETHPYLGPSWFNLAEAQLLEGDFDAALESYPRAIAVAEANRPPENIWLGAYYGIYGRALGRAGQGARAAEAFDKGLKLLEQTPGPDHPLTARVRVEYAAFLNDQGRFPEARQIVESVLPRLEQVYTADSREFALGLLQHGRALARDGDSPTDAPRAIRELREGRETIARSAHRTRYAREIAEAGALLARLGDTP